jgi:hypothetical protein
LTCIPFLPSFYRLPNSERAQNLSLSLSLSLFFFQGEFDDSFKLEMGKNPLLPERKKNTTITSSTSVSFYVLNL